MVSLLRCRCEVEEGQFLQFLYHSGSVLRAAVLDFPGHFIQSRTRLQVRQQRECTDLYSNLSNANNNYTDKVQQAVTVQSACSGSYASSHSLIHSSGTTAALPALASSFSLSRPSDFSQSQLKQISGLLIALLSSGSLRIPPFRQLQLLLPTT